VEPKRGSRGNLTRLEGVQACYFTSAAAFDPERTFASCSRRLRTRFFSSSTWTETSLVRNVHVGGKVGVILVIAVLALVVRYLNGLEQTSEFSAARRAYVQAHPETAGARFAICYSCGFRSRYLANWRQLRFGMRVQLPAGTETAFAEVSTKGDLASSIELA
jgi:hypothetical protein